MADNDIVLLESISELVELSGLHVPFLIQETGSADCIPALGEFISGRMGRFAIACL